MLRRISWRALCVLIGLWIPLTSQAANDFWNNPAGGNFGDGLNWLDGSAPTATDGAIFDLDAGPYTVTLTQNQNITFFNALDGVVDFELGGFKLDANLANGFGIGTGVADDATASFTNGTLETSGNATIGGSDSVASMTLSGPNFRWDAALVNIGSCSFCDVSVTIEDGAVVNSISSGTWRVGHFPNSTTTLTVTGSGTLLDGPSLQVGLGASNAQVIISDGAVVDMSTLINPSPSFTSTVTVTGAGSLLRGTLLQIADTGSSGTAALDAQLAGRVEHSDLELAQSVGTTGLVTIGGASGGTDAVVDISDDAFIARGVFNNDNTGTAVVTVNPGGHFVVDDDLNLGGNGTAGSGTLNVLGGKVTVRDLIMRNTGALNFPAGEIIVNGSANSNVDLVVQGGTASDNPTITGNGGWSVTGDLFIGGDSAGPGNPGTVTSVGISTTGDTHIYPSGAVSLIRAIITQDFVSEGTLNLQAGGGGTALDVQSLSITGAFDWDLGTIVVRGPAGVSTNDFPTDTLTIPIFAELDVTHATTVQAGDDLTLAGGELKAGTFNVGVNDVFTVPLPTNVVVDGVNALLHVTGNTYIAGSAAGESNFGTVETTNGGRVDVDGDLTIFSKGRVIVRATTSVNVDGTLTVHGVLELPAAEELTVDRLLVPDGFLVWTGGDLTLGEGDLHVGTTNSSTASNLGSATTIPNSRVLTVPGEAVIGEPGVTSAGSLTVGNGAVLNTGAGKDTTIGSQGSVQLNNGRINSRRLNVMSGGELSGNGTVDAIVLADMGSTITATSNLALGKAAVVNGFYSNGDMIVESGTTTLLDANAAVFDSAALVRLGGSDSPGTIAASKGLTLDFGGNLVGFGTVDTPDNIATPLTNNGDIAGNSGAEPITLSGYVKGVGTLDNVVITGTDAPGFSPATVVRGSVVYDGTLEIEIGGTASGSFDRINHILGAGTAQLGGALDVLLINGFNPALNDSFEFITASSGISGEFATLAEDLPALSTGLEWDIDYGANNVVLQVVAAGIPGDFNLDGTVDAADYVVWRKGLVAATPANYDLWRARFGQTSGSGGSENGTVPEPATLGLLLLATAAGGMRCRTASGVPSTSLGAHRDLAVLFLFC